MSRVCDRRSRSEGRCPQRRRSSHLNVSVERVAVSSADWLDDADSQTKCNTDDVWREGKKKGVEGEDSWPESGDEVSATEWRGTERLGGVAAGGIEAGRDRAGTGAAPEHGVAGAAAQPVAARRPVSSESGAGANAGAPEALAAQQPVWERAVGAGGRVVEGSVEPGTSLRALALAERTEDQPRDHLPAHLAGSAPWRRSARTSARSAQELPETLRALRQPGAPGGEKNDRRTAGERRVAAAARPLGDRHHDGREPGREQSLRAHPGRTQERLFAHGQTPGPDRGRDQPRLTRTLIISAGRARSPRTSGPSSTGMGKWKRRARSSSTSPRRITAGNAGPTRTPTG